MVGGAGARLTQAAAGVVIARKFPHNVNYVVMQAYTYHYKTPAGFEDFGVTIIHDNDSDKRDASFGSTWYTDTTG